MITLSLSKGNGIRSKLAWCGTRICAIVGCRWMGIDWFRVDATRSWGLSVGEIARKKGDMYVLWQDISLCKSNPRQRALFSIANRVLECGV